MSLDLERAPTLDEILRGCIEAFDDGGRVRDPRLVRLFLLVHAWYLPSAELVAKLLRIMEDAGDSAEGPSLRLRVSHLVRYWLTAFPAELELGPELWGRLRALKEALGGGPGGGPGAIARLEALQGAGGLQELLSPGGPPEPAPPPGAPPRRKASLLLEHLEAAELAAHLTHLEHRAFCRVRLQDYRSFARSGGPAGSPALQRVIALFNGVSRWAQLLVLSPTAAPQRARVLARFLHVAQRLLELQNFQTLMAVVGGLGHSSIARLHRTLALLPPDDTKLWQRLSSCLSSSGNFSRYRRLLAAAGGAGGFRLPALGVHLRDLVALHEALPDWGDPARSRPHPAKLRQLGAELGALLLARGQRPPGADGVDEGVLDLLTVSLELPQTEEELYRLSLQREPRASGKRPRAAQAPPARPPPLEEWGLPEPPPPDPALLRAHVEKMVESVFRNFDVDGDGRISREEFGIVRDNFPQLRFGELDTDRDGSLSRAEVVAFFLRCGAGPPARAGLVHCFQESRALRPAACRHCRAPILGIYKQGLKCRTCGVRCHRQCRERLRVECRRRARSFAAESPPGTPPARDPPGDSPGTPPASSRPPRGRSFSFSLPWPRRSVAGSAATPPGTPPETPKTPPGTPPGPPPDVQELEDGVFDIHL